MAPHERIPRRRHQRGQPRQQLRGGGHRGGDPRDPPTEERRARRLPARRATAHGRDQAARVDAHRGGVTDRGAPKAHCTCPLNPDKPRRTCRLRADASVEEGRRRSGGIGLDTPFLRSRSKRVRKVKPNRPAGTSGPSSPLHWPRCSTTRAEATVRALQRTSSALGHLKRHDSLASSTPQGKSWKTALAAERQSRWAVGLHRSCGVETNARQHQYRCLRTSRSTPRPNSAVATAPTPAGKRGSLHPPSHAASPKAPGGPTPRPAAHPSRLDAHGTL